ncbi:hypothetical protein STEG23_033547, partial [Scotinomys teguina]
NDPAPFSLLVKLTLPTGRLSESDLTHCFLQVRLVGSVVDAVRVCNLTPTSHPENCCFVDGTRPGMP